MPTFEAFDTHPIRSELKETLTRASTEFICAIGGAMACKELLADGPGSNFTLLGGLAGALAGLKLHEYRRARNDTPNDLENETEA